MRLTPVLAYHKIEPHPTSGTPSLTPSEFRRQCTRIKEYGYRTPALEEYIASIKNGALFLKKAVLLTFDDGTDDFYKWAFPILKEMGLGAVVFLITGNVGTKGYLSWEQCNEMARYGVYFGSHTHNHAYLPSLNEDQKEKELTLSRDKLREYIKPSVLTVSYPAGGFDNGAKALAKKTGYEIAFTTNRAERRAVMDRYALRRIKMSAGSSRMVIMLAKLSGFYDSFRKLRKPA